MRYTGPKNRIARRDATDLGLKTLGSKSHARLLKKLNALPGQHATRGRRKVSEYGLQLREKQKLRFMFGVTEKQMKKYFKQASQKKGNTAFYLSQSLEKRLDNVIYRLGFVPTRAAARQLVTHGHIKVNDAEVSTPSFEVRPGNIIGFVNEKSTKIPAVESSLTNKDQLIPKWFERQAATGKILTDPTDEEIRKQVNLRLVVEFYSR